jgi:hypothetical protein
MLSTIFTNSFVRISITEGNSLVFTLSAVPGNTFSDLTASFLEQHVTSEMTHILCALIGVLTNMI